jgi:hypothetical protein
VPFSGVRGADEFWGIGDNVNLGKEHSVSAPRRDWTRQVSAMVFAVVVGVFGLVGVHPTEGRADASAAIADGAPVVDLPVPPRLLITDPPTTTTTAPVETTTTTAPPPVETTTTTTVPPPPTTGPPRPKPPAPARSAASTGPAAQAQVEAIADSSGWNWRTAGVRINVGFYPADCCHWGVYESAKSIIWIGPTAFEDPNRLRYVVLHELAHAWQYRQNRFAQFISDYAAWGFNTIGPALEAGADCVANVWGAAGGHYWNCPADARALASRRLSGDWR